MLLLAAGSFKIYITARTEPQWFQTIKSEPAASRRESAKLVRGLTKHKLDQDSDHLTTALPMLGQPYLLPKLRRRNSLTSGRSSGSCGLGRRPAHRHRSESHSFQLRGLFRREGEQLRTDNSPSTSSRLQYYPCLFRALLCCKVRCKPSHSTRLHGQLQRL